MIKQIREANENIKPNTKAIEVLQENFPSCFDKDGSFDIGRFKEFLSDKTKVKNEGYELKFLGKNCSRLLASVDTTCVVVPDKEHNNKPENKDSENIYISGDNLNGLKILLKSYENKIKSIYIDPPYNTGSDGYVKRHFKDICEYNKEISLGILSSQRSKKKKKYFPSVVDDFVKGSIQNSNKIYVLLINMQLISKRKDNLLNIDNYDYSVAGFYRPYDALAATKPILIIDEPHRFATDKTTYTTITKNIKPQCIIRFGATFPEITEGKGKY